MPCPRGLVYVSQGNITGEVWVAAGLGRGVVVVVPIHHRRKWAQPGTALTARLHLIEWGLNTGNKWPLLDTNSLFTSGYSYLAETLQKNELNETLYVSRMEMYTVNREEKMHPLISSKMVLLCFVLVHRSYGGGEVSLTTSFNSAFVVLLIVSTHL